LLKTLHRGAREAAPKKLAKSGAQGGAEEPKGDGGEGKRDLKKTKS